MPSCRRFCQLPPAASVKPGEFDVESAAQPEFDWWRTRLEAVGLEQYGVTIACAAASTNGKQP